MTITVSPFLRNALLLDVVASGATAILAMGGASFLSPWLGLPADLLFWSGAVLVPFVAFLVAMARRETLARMTLIVNDHGIGTLFFRAKGTPAFGVERHAGQRPIRRSWSGLHSLIGCG